MKEDAESSHHSSWTKSVKWIPSSSLICNPHFQPGCTLLNLCQWMESLKRTRDVHQFALMNPIRERHGVAVWNSHCEDSRNSMFVGEERLPLSCTGTGSRSVGLTPPPSCSMPPPDCTSSWPTLNACWEMLQVDPSPQQLLHCSSTTEACHSFATEAAVGCSIQTSCLHDLDSK